MSDSPFERDHWKGRGWELFLYNPAPGVLYTRVMGHADLPCVRVLMGAFDRVASLTPDKMEVFHDWERVTGYEAEVRPEYTRWSKGHLHCLAGLHILIRSRLLAMGITVANAALNGAMTAHYERAEFEKLRAEAILRRRRTAEAGPTSGLMSRSSTSRPPTIPPASGTVSTSPPSAPPSGLRTTLRPSDPGTSSSDLRSSDPSTSRPPSGPLSVRRVP